MLKPRIAADYSASVTGASFSVLLEVINILGAYRDSLVLVGGWVPYLLLRERGVPGFQHVGSIDIDLIVDPAIIESGKYATIVQRLKDRGYKPDPDIRYRLNRSVAGIAAPIGIDFLTPQAPIGAGRTHRHRKIQADLEARSLPFAEIALKHFISQRIEGPLPEKGGKTALDIKMCAIPAFFALKGCALGERYKEKDAYDLFAVARYYGRGVEEVAHLLKPHLADPGLRQALTNIREKFRSLDTEGPSWVVKFLAPATEDESQRLRQDSFIAMDEFLRKLGKNRSKTDSL